MSASSWLAFTPRDTVFVRDGRSFDASADRVGQTVRPGPVLAASLEPAGLLVFTWRDGGPPAPRPLRELESRQVGRHTYTVLLEILDADEEAYRACYLHRITEGGKVISEEELTGYAYRPPWNVLARELVTAGFTQAEGTEGLLAWRLA